MVSKSKAAVSHVGNGSWSLCAHQVEVIHFPLHKAGSGACCLVRKWDIEGSSHLENTTYHLGEVKGWALTSASVPTRLDPRPSFLLKFNHSHLSGPTLIHPILHLFLFSGHSHSHILSCTLFFRLSYHLALSFRLLTHCGWFFWERGRKTQVARQLSG